MILYQLHDDPEKKYDPEDRTCLAIWADSPEQAKLWYVQSVEYEGGPVESLDEIHCEQAFFSNKPGVQEFQPAKPGVHIECRDEVLRLLGWAVENDNTCSTCGLAEMDDIRWRVCEGCCQCPDCGCRCDK